MKDLVSIVIRTKNEERWISQCLNGVFEQDYKNFEVIIVDNNSSDKTIDKAKQYKVKSVLNYSDNTFFPGKALNMGIENAEGKYIVSLSGHCLPVYKTWLSDLIKNFDDEKVAGVYGRQEAMSFTPDSDKRELGLKFGLDRIEQLKDNFFHNANSAIRQDLWKKIPFDPTISNIEDRLWAKEMQREGYKIIYEPLAAVDHYHGIQQNGNKERCKNVVRIMEEKLDYKYKPIGVEKLNIVGIIPVKGTVQNLNEKPLLAYTIQRALESRYIKKVIVSTDSTETANLAKKLGAEAPFIRPAALSEGNVDLDQVLQCTLEQIEQSNIHPDLIMSFEITFPFRPEGLIDDMILKLAQEGLDSVVAAKIENRAIWKDRKSEIIQIDEGLTPRQFKDPAFIELRGIGCVTHPEFLRKGHLLGERIGIYEVNNPYSHLEVRSSDDIKMAARLIEEWFK